MVCTKNIRKPTENQTNTKKNQERVKRLNNDVLSTEIQIKQSNQFIREKEAERKLILHKYAKDSKRFIELNTKH